MPSISGIPVADPPSLDATAVTAAPASLIRHKQVQRLSKCVPALQPATATSMPPRRIRVSGSIFMSVTMMVAAERELATKLYEERDHVSAHQLRV